MRAKTLFFSLLCLSVGGLAGCGAGKDSQETGDTTETGQEPAAWAWDAEAEAVDCVAGTIDAPLLDAALADAGLSIDELGYTAEHWSHASYKNYLDDPFLLSWFREHLMEPLRFLCSGAQLAADLDHAATTDHPVATALGEMMVLVDTPPVSEAPQIAEADLASYGLASTDLPEELTEALGDILSAMEEVGAVREALDAVAPANTNKLVKYGHGGIIIDFESSPDLTSASDQDWLVSADGPRSFYDPARVLAYAIEEADLERFRDTDALLDIELGLGRVIVAGSGADAPGEIGNVALYIDLGGDDTYVHPVGANNKAVPVSVHIDLGGNDTYGYVEHDEGTDALLPSDQDGRYQGDDNLGRFSLSRVGRQGSGRFGVGMLFDYGQGDDQYRSLRVSQGWGHLGVGVLFDDGGDDLYLGEEGVQGSASLGLGLFMDLGGNDTHRTLHTSQGFAYVGAAGMAWDGGGDDTWYANPGKEEDGGTTVYSSPQLPSGGNSSFCQGMALGMRNDAGVTFLSGGVAALRDRGGDDDYMAGTFAQGSGYWQGTGYLLEGDGHDLYDAYYYVQGGAAHYAAGILLDEGDGDDALNSRLVPNYMHFGAGHDFSVGIHVNEAGNDDYVYGGLAAGASNCQGVGLLVDNDGMDTYEALSSYSTGLGNHSGECASRTGAPSIGLFLDSGGDEDTYVWPGGDGLPVPANDSVFGHRHHETEDEFGGAADGDGETSLHAGGDVMP